MSKHKILFAQIAAAALLAVAFVGCSGAEPDSYEAVKEAAAPVKEATSEVLVAAKLAGADLADGTQDKVVSRCPGCMLAMEGSADHAIQVEGYELHFCSEACQHKFEEDDVMAKVAKLEIPES